MRAVAVLVVLCLAGGATEREIQQYDSDMKSWHTGNQESGDAWNRATGGSYGGGGIGSAPKDPRGTIHLN